MDEDDGDLRLGDLSLREALGLASSNLGSNEIRFDPGLAGGTITLVDGLGPLLITSDLDLLGLNVALDAAGNSGVLFVAEAVTANVSNLMITGGLTLYGSGILNEGTLSLDNVTIAANGSSTTWGGGGIRNTGTLSLTNSTIVGNAAASGGGILNEGALSVANSTIRSNSADSNGGGIYNAFGGTLSVANSTISRNSAAESGGGIHNAGTLWVANSTISGNSAAPDGGGVHTAGDASTTLYNTIVALNDGSDIAGTLEAGSGFNLIGMDPHFVRNQSDGGDGWGDNPTTPDIDESENDDYGDLRLAHGSPAIDAGDPNIVDPPATDQGGSQRFVDGNGDGVARIDIGAYQYAPASVAARRVFYNHSRFDDNDPLPNAADAAAIAVDKTPLRPGQSAGFANYTSYDKGINGIIVDIAELPVESLTAADFEFLVGNSNDQANWTPAPEPQSIDVIPGMGIGGADRVTIIWPDNTIQNTGCKSRSWPPIARA